MCALTSLDWFLFGCVCVLALGKVLYMPELKHFLRQQSA